MKKTFCAVSLFASFCAAVSPSDIANSQNTAVESKQISQNSNKIATVLQNKTINSNLQISQNNEVKSKNANLQILANNDKIAIVYKGEI